MKSKNDDIQNMIENYNENSYGKTYKETFDNVHAPEELLRKVKGISTMKEARKKSYIVRKLGYAAAALVVLVVASNGIVYAATGETWVHKAVISVNGKDKVVEFTKSKDKNGEDVYSTMIEDTMIEDNDGQVEIDIVGEEPSDGKLSIENDENGAYIEYIGDGEEDITEKGTESAIILSKDKNFVLKVYAAPDASQQLSTVYEDGTVYEDEDNLKEIEIGERVYLGKYSPLDSSVPGFPIIISDVAQFANEYTDIMSEEKVRLETENGEFVLWESDTGKVEHVGQTGLFRRDEKIFWSPLTDDGLCSETKIIVCSDKNEAGKIVLSIKEADEGEYYAEIVE